jgi:tetratricopeptide (TPR) repeat protein
MMALRRPVAVAALWLAAGAFCGLAAQTVSKRRIAQSETPAEAALRELLAAAQLALDNKDYAAAIQKYSEYIAKKPEDAAAHVDLGYAYTALGQRDSAIAEYRKAIELDAKMADAYRNLGLALLRAKPAEAVEPLRHYVELRPGEGQPRFLLGLALEGSGQYAAAIEQFEAGETAEPKNAGEYHLHLGRCYLALNGRASSAETEFRAAIRDLPAGMPDASDVRLGLAQSLIAQKKNAEAAAALEEYLKLKPDDKAAHLERAGLLAGLDKPDEAIAELDRASAGAPEDLASLKVRSSIYFQMKKYDDAIAALQKAVLLAPEDADLHARLGHLWLEKKNYAFAVRELVASCRLDSRSTDTLRDLLAAEFASGNYPAALQGLDLLAQRETPNARAWFVRGVCYDKLGQKKEAIAAYKRFLEMNAGQANDEYFQASVRVRALERELKEK